MTAEVTRLQDELSSTKKSLRSFLEKQSSIYEELQSANEEVLSANEELQSTNEELETTKEELQSTNEELVTLNEELSNRNTELITVNNDLSNVLSSAHVAIVMVSSDLNLRRFTPAAGKLLNLHLSDIGRKLTDFNLGLQTDCLEEKLLETIQNVVTLELEVRDRMGRYYSIRIRPYKTTDNRIDGAVMSLIDIDEVKTKEHAAQATHRYSDAIIQTIHDPLVVLNQALQVERVNRAFYEIFQGDENSTIGKKFYELEDGQWNIPELRKLLEEVLPSRSEVRGFKINHKFKGIGTKNLLINVQRLEWEQQKEILILLAIRDTNVDLPNKKSKEMNL